MFQSSFKVFIFTKVYEYPTSWPFGFFGNNALLGAFSSRETGRFVALSTLGGLPNFPEFCWTNGDFLYFWMFFQYLK